MGAKPLHRLAFFVHNELGKIPFDGVPHKTTLFFLEIDPKGVSIVSVDVNLAEHVKGDVVLPSGELLDLRLRAGLLPTKLIAGKCQDS